MKDQILAHLPGDHPWQNQIYWFDSIDSTNARAKEMAANGAPHGTVLIAGHQTAGRGRLGRSFHSPAGQGVYLSVVLRPQCKPDALMHLTCATAVAMCDAVSSAVALRPGIKWTNDLVLGKRKIAGILTELSVDSASGIVDWVIIGVGINCCQSISDFPPEIQSFAGSLSMATCAAVDQSRVAAAMITELHKMSLWLLSPPSQWMQRYRDNCITIGQDISLLRGDDVRHGHAIDVDNNGALLVRFPDGHVEPINSGEVSIRGMYGYV